VGRGVVVLGDFNDSRDAPAIAPLFDAGLVDLIATHLHEETRGRIDYLLTDRPLAGWTWTAQIWPTSRSDHDALLADLAW
jgi:endonuclease/exonuclease/phosphatase family metal-dependent hydrolase